MFPIISDSSTSRDKSNFGTFPMKIIIPPFCRIIANVIFNAYKFLTISDNMVIKPWLPGKFNKTHFPNAFRAHGFELANNRSQRIRRQCRDDPTGRPYRYFPRNYYNAMQMVWHNHEFIQSHIWSDFWCFLPFFRNNFSDFGQFHLAFFHMTKPTKSVFCTDGYKIFARACIIPIGFTG